MENKIFIKSAANPETTKIYKSGVTNSDITAIQMQVGNGIAVVTTGIAGRIYLPCGVTVYEWCILADASGSMVFDIWVDTYPNVPAIADTITAAAKPTLSSVQYNRSSALTGWITCLKAGSWLIVNVDSCTTIKQATLCLLCRKGL